jgi:hypothetical protein
MSLDATILGIERDGDDVVLTLGPRIDDADKPSIEGQRTMRILDASYVPEVGTDLWGGDSLVELCSTPKRQYRREGYTRMREVTQEDRHEAQLTAVTAERDALKADRDKFLVKANELSPVNSLHEAEVGVPAEVREELLRCAVSNGSISYHYLLNLYKRGGYKQAAEADRGMP